MYYFRNPKRLDGEMMKPWSLAAGYDGVKHFVSDLKKAGLLEIPKGRKALNILKVGELKDILRDNELKVSGKKDQLLDRIMESVDYDAYTPFNIEKFVGSTELGDIIAKKWIEESYLAMKLTYENIKELLRKKEYVEIERCVISHDKEYSPLAFRFDEGTRVSDTISIHSTDDNEIIIDTEEKIVHSKPGWIDPNDFDVEVQLQWKVESRGEEIITLDSIKTLEGFDDDAIEDLKCQWFFGYGKSRVPEGFRFKEKVSIEFIHMITLLNTQTSNQIFEKFLNSGVELNYPYFSISSIHLGPYGETQCVNCAAIQTKEYQPTDYPKLPLKNCINKYCKCVYHGFSRGFYEFKKKYVDEYLISII
ncbi:MAG: SAP domain-containing protein [Candidatus Heimdallarchaeota archaeon]|nr:SAP domain-containing protein [Candidatus Heimdallarchaeota archaeon]